MPCSKSTVRELPPPESFYIGSSSPDGGSEIRSVIVSDPSIQIPHVKKKVLRYCQWPNVQTAKSQAPVPKTPRTDTILPKHLLAHTLITYVYSHYCIWSFYHHFPCKNDVLITSTRIEFSNHKNIAVAYTNFLSIASCRIVNVRYRNDLLLTESVVVSYLSFINRIFTKMMCRVVINSFKYFLKITREENNKIIKKKIQHKEINIKSCN